MADRTDGATTSLIRPPALRPGDRVAVISASAPLSRYRLDRDRWATDDARFERSLEALRSLGLQPDVLPSARATGDFPLGSPIAGPDALRAADLTTALSDPSYAAVICARGGYGAQRTLEAVDWAEVGTPTPRILIGYSDVTALLEAVATKLGWVSFFGPMPEGIDYHPGSYAFDTMTRLLMKPDEVRELAFPGAAVLVPGAAEGVTLGGTITLLTGSINTATSRPARGGILFLEDVHEEPYRLDGYLTHMRRSGYLDGVAGILCGSFTDCGPREEVDKVLRDRLGDLGVPVLTGIDIGHGIPMQTWPVGVRARLDADARVLRLLDPVLC